MESTAAESGRAVWGDIDNPTRPEYNAQRRRWEHFPGPHTFANRTWPAWIKCGKNLSTRIVASAAQQWEPPLTYRSGGIILQSSSADTSQPLTWCWKNEVLQLVYVHRLRLKRVLRIFEGDRKEFCALLRTKLFSNIVISSVVFYIAIDHNLQFH